MPRFLELCYKPPLIFLCAGEILFKKYEWNGMEVESQREFLLSAEISGVMLLGLIKENEIWIKSHGVYAWRGDTFLVSVRKVRCNILHLHTALNSFQKSTSLSVQDSGWRHQVQNQAICCNIFPNVTGK